jgi:3-hydroxyacyl-CoA dehydrogenase
MGSAALHACSRTWAAEVLLLDIVPERGRGQQRQNGAQQDRQRRSGLRAQEQPLAASTTSASRSASAPGNFDDDLPKIKDCDWIIEVVIERLDIKQQVLHQRGEIPHARHADHQQHQRHSDPCLQLDGRSDDFRKALLSARTSSTRRATCRLLELIPSPKTDPSGDRLPGGIRPAACWARSP